MRQFSDFLKFQYDLPAAKPVIIVDLSGGYKFGSRKIEFNDVSYDDEFTSIGSIDQKINLFSRGMATISDMDFLLESPSLSFWDKFKSPSDCKVYLTFLTSSIGDVNVADARGLLFHGDVINQRYTTKEIEFSIINSLRKYYIPLPQHSITYEEYPLAEDGILGATIPIVYGNFYFHYGGDERPFQDLIKDGVTSPCLLIDTSSNQYVFASHPVFAFDIPTGTPAMQLSNIVQLESSNRQLINFEDPQATKNIAAGFSWFTVDLDEDHRAWCHHIPSRRGTGGSVPPFSPQNVLDGPNPSAVTTYTTVGFSQTLSVKWKSYPFPEMLSGPNWPFLYVIFQSSGGNPISYRISTYLMNNDDDPNFMSHRGSNANAYAGTCIAGAVAENYTDFVDLNYWYRTFPADKRDVKGSDFKDICLQVENCGVQAFTIKFIYFSVQDLGLFEEELITQVGKWEPYYFPGAAPGESRGLPGTGIGFYNEVDGVRYPYIPDREWHTWDVKTTAKACRFSNDYHCISKGRMYNENSIWMSGSLGRWTNSDAYRTGELIENPIHIIESLYRDELGLGDSIDIGSFDLAASRRVDYDAAGFVHGLTNSWDIIDSLSKEFRIGILHLPSIDSDEGKIFAIVRDWDDADHMDEAYVSGSFHENFMEDFEVWQTPISEVYNDFVISFGYSSIFADTRFEVYANCDADNHGSEDLTILCQQASDDHLQQIKNSYKASLRWCRQHATAERILSDIVNLRTRRWWHCSFMVQLQGSIIDGCDIISIRHSLLPDSLQDKKWEVSRARIDPETSKVRIECTCINPGAE